MNTEKKNQHYIPKFYLRNFSYRKNNNQIGIFNLKNDFYYQTSKLKTQGSKNFFYGYDGFIEDRLAEIEGDLSKTINDIISYQTLPKKNSKEHVDLLVFVGLSDARNPVRIENMKAMITQMKERVFEGNPDAKANEIIPSLSHDEAVRISISNIPEITMNIMDLDYKLLINETDKPFISSDFPIVKYNQYLEEKNWPYSKSGYGLVGLQIFIPLNSKIVLHFFDSAIYKVGERKQKTIALKSNTCVDQINKLQFVNCLETIYFDENASENYIRELRTQTLKYKRANISKSELSYIVGENEDPNEILAGEKNLIIMGSSDCEIKLKIEGIKIHSIGKAYKLTSGVSQVRKHIRNLKDIQNRR